MNHLHLIIDPRLHCVYIINISLKCCYNKHLLGVLKILQLKDSV